MNLKLPLFLTVEQVMRVHEKMVECYGGSYGIRELGLIESAVAQGRNVFYYANADVFTIAATYAFHLAESQAFIDGNKRVGSGAALVFLSINDVDVTHINTEEVYEMMIRIATKELSKSGLADLLRDRLA